MADVLALQHQVSRVASLVLEGMLRHNFQDLDRAMAKLFKKLSKDGARGGAFKETGKLEKAYLNLHSDVYEMKGLLSQLSPLVQTLLELGEDASAAAQLAAQVEGIIQLEEALLEKMRLALKLWKEPELQTSELKFLMAEIQEIQLICETQQGKL